MAVEAILALATFGLSLLLAIVTALAAARTKALRFAFASLAFAGFATRQLLFVMGREGAMDAGLVPASTTSLAIDAAVVVLLYLAIVKE